MAIQYLAAEERDAQDTRKEVEAAGRRCLLIVADFTGGERACREVMEKAVTGLGKLDILVNNAATQVERESLAEVSEQQLETTFKVNLFSQFHLCKLALPHLRAGSAIINCASVNHYKGHPTLIDYTATKGAIVAFTRSLALSLAEKGIRVNAVAPGPIWDAADCEYHVGGEQEEVWHFRPDEAAGPAGGGGNLLRLPCLSRCELHQRSDAAPERWCCGECMRSVSTNKQGSLICRR